MNRTCDLRFRKPLLYPLSYGGVGSSLLPQIFGVAVHHAPVRHVVGAGDTGSTLISLTCGVERPYYELMMA